MLVVAWALGRRDLRVADRRDHRAGPQLGGARPGQRGACPRLRATLLTRSTTSSGRRFFPRYLEPFSPEKIVEVSPGDKRILRDPDVVRAGESVLKIRGTNDCGRGVEGSGFLYAENRLMTNAHVVAGVDDPEVEVGDDNVPATVVEYDPELDIAVLEFDSGSLPVLPFNDPESPAQRRGRRRDPRLPRGRSLRRPGRPDPRPAAAALPRHLRRRRGDPRGLLAARPGPARQLRWPDRQLGRARSSASSSRPRSPTRTPATRSPRPRSPRPLRWGHQRGRGVDRRLCGLTRVEPSSVAPSAATASSPRRAELRRSPGARRCSTLDASARPDP